MFVPDWTELALSGVERISKLLSDEWPERNWREALMRMSPRVAKLPFYRSIELLGLVEHDLPAPNERFFLVDDVDATRLNWTNEPIYSVNERDGMIFTPTTLIAYTKFFFHMVRGQLGRFLIVETPEELLWNSEESRAKGIAEIVEKNIAIGSVIYKGPHASGDLHVLECYMQFKNALFKAEIYVAPYETDVMNEETGSEEHFTMGQMKIANEELLLEDMDVRVDPPPGEFG